jgi:hypothetical protein
VIVTVYVPAAAAVVVRVTVAVEPAANDWGFTVADTAPSAGDTEAERPIVEGELIWVVWTVLDVPAPAVRPAEVGVRVRPKSAVGVPEVVTVVEELSEDTEPSEARALTW